MSHFKSARRIYGKEKKMLWLRSTTDLNNTMKLLWESCSKDYFLHPNFKPKLPRQNPIFTHDIALVQTVKSIDGHDLVHAIQLPPKMDWPSPECETGEIAGYGVVKGDGTRHARTLLRWVSIEIMNTYEVIYYFITYDVV